MAAINLTKFAGLVTAPGLLERAEASCIRAVNWEFPAPGVMRKRRGFERLSSANAGAPVWKLFTSRLMGPTLLAHVGTGTQGTQLRFGDGSIPLVAIPVVGTGNLTRASDTRMQLAVCQQNHYLTADEGVARLESDFITASTSARFAGMPRGQGHFGTPTLTGATATFGVGYARAYRVTWHRKDASDVELGGAPTSRFVVANATYNSGYTGAACAQLGLTVQVPREFGTVGTYLSTGEYFWRLWGTRTYLEASELGDDEMHLVAERYLTVTEIANGYFSYGDTTPDAFLLSSPTLHTNLANFPAGEAGIRQGVVNEDAPPPGANDVTYWQDVMWYGDISTRPSLAVSNITALADGDTVSVTSNGATMVITARTVVLSPTEFQIVTTAATSALNIRQTIMHMVACLNVQNIVNNTAISAHTVSTTSTQPGLVYIECTRRNVGPLVFTSSAATKWQGLGGYVLNAQVNSVAQSNLLYFSKPLRADAVPPINALSVGPADSRILRIHPLRDRLLVFTDYGIFQVTGRTFADFAAYPFDLGYRLIGREMVALCDEHLYAWCNEGIVEIDDGGVRVISAPIEPTIENAMVDCAGGGSSGGTPLTQGRAVFGTLGFATAYRNQHQVRFHFPEWDDSTLNGCAYWLSFDTRTRCWAQGQFSQRRISSWYDNRSCAVVRFVDDLLACGNWSSGADTYLYLERRSYVSTDFTDDTINGQPDAVLSVARFQYQLPDYSGAVHWQQTVINWDAEEVQYRPLPTSIDITHGTEEVTPANQLIAVAELATRLETPQDARRGQRLFVQLSHEVIEYAGVVGVSQSYRSGARFARRVAP